MLFERGLTFPLGRIVAIESSTRRSAETVAPLPRSRFRAGKSWRPLLLRRQDGYHECFRDRTRNLSTGRAEAEAPAVLHDRRHRDVRRPRDEPHVRWLAFDADLGRSCLSTDGHVPREADHRSGAVPDDA